MNKKTKQPHVLVLDPIAFSGGSKKATSCILNLLASDTHITVVSSNINDWKKLEHEHVTLIKLFEPKILAHAEIGYLYFIRHLFIFFQLLVVKLRSKPFKGILGTSGPGVDLALYFFKYFTHIPLIQLIQGPVAVSNTIAKCLHTADLVYYLPSCTNTIQQCLKHYAERAHKPYFFIHEAENFKPMNNGLPKQEWPEPKVVYNQAPKLLWAASLLKWKGLNTLTESLYLFDDATRPTTSICYIKPVDTIESISNYNQNIQHVTWHSELTDLASFRIKHDIYISTSHQEPFGLAILEAMASGLCVVIPSDGAYWDQKLTDGISCIKYEPHNAEQLKEKLKSLCATPHLVKRIGEESLLIATNYQAEKTYKPIVDSLNSVIQLEIANEKTYENA